MCICNLCLPVRADEVGQIDTAIMFQTCMSQPIPEPTATQVAAYEIKQAAKLAKGKPKKKLIVVNPNGNIVVDGKEYTPTK